MQQEGVRPPHSLTLPRTAEVEDVDALGDVATPPQPAHGLVGDGVVPGAHPGGHHEHPSSLVLTTRGGGRGAVGAR
jgi:hypothetical protein